MKYILTFLLLSFTIVSCSNDDSQDSKPKITSITPVKAKIGDTITIIGSNLNNLGNITFKHRHEEFEYGNVTSGYTYVTQSDEKVTIQIPKMMHEDISIYTYNVGFVDYELIGFIPLGHLFPNNISQIQVLNDNIAFVLSNGKIYKSTDGFHTWSLLYQSNQGEINSFYFLDEEHGWIGKSEENSAVFEYSIHYSENGGNDFNYKFMVNNEFSGGRINKIQFTSLTRGFFIDHKNNMYTTDNNSFENIYDYYTDLALLPIGQADILNFNAINDNLIFLTTESSPAVIKIDNQNIDLSIFETSASHSHFPQFFNSTGYLQLNNGDLYKSVDLGDTWSRIKSFEESIRYIYFADALTGFAFDQGSGYTYDHLSTNDGGITWEKSYIYSRGIFTTPKDFIGQAGLMANTTRRLWKYIKD